MAQVLSDYQGGLHTAVKYQACRVDFDHALDRALRSGPGRH